VQHETAQAIACSTRFLEMDEFIKAVRGADMDFIPMGTADYAASLTVVNIGDLLLQRGEEGPHITRGSISQGMTQLLLPVPCSAAIPPEVNGTTAGESDCFLLAPGSEIHVVCRSRQRWVALGVPDDEMRLLTAQDDRLTSSHGSAHLLHLPPKLAGRMLGALGAVCDLAENMGGYFGRYDFTHSLGGGIREMLTETFLAANPETGSKPRAARDAMRLLRLAEEYLRSNIARPIFLDELCGALAVSPRRLHQVFITTCGLSPQVYLKRQRLMLVRRALRSGGADARLVKSVALGHGFWHLGNFARDYRAMFNECPSDTLLAQRTSRLH